MLQGYELSLSSSLSSVTSGLGPTGPFRLQDSSKTVLSISSLVVPHFFCVYAYSDILVVVRGMVPFLIGGRAKGMNRNSNKLGLWICNINGFEL
jgi:hypothetical protein